MAFQSINPGTLLNPTPCVMVSCQDTQSHPNIITIAWTGTVNTVPAMVSISVRPERHSFGIIERSGEFVINLVTKDLLRACDFCGVRSGKDVDKFAHLSLTPAPMDKLSLAPRILQSPLALGCKVARQIPLGSHTMFLATVESCMVDEAIMDAAGKIDLNQAGLTCYNHGEYFALGEKLGFFGYSVAKPDVFKRRMGS